VIPDGAELPVKVKHLEEGVDRHNLLFLFFVSSNVVTDEGPFNVPERHE
jgi:hypothetical protein